MIKYEDQCVCCDWCIGFGCPYKEKVPVHYCDKCGETLDYDGIYEVDGEELCDSCLCEKFRRR